MSISSSAEGVAFAAPWMTGRRVLVTGGTGGIGLALALAFGTVQVWLSGLLVRRYGSGPLEKLLRRVVYGRP